MTTGLTEEQACTLQGWASTLDEMQGEIEKMSTELNEALCTNRPLPKKRRNAIDELVALWQDFLEDTR